MVYRSRSILEGEGLLKRSVREGTREVFDPFLHSTLENTGVQIDKSEPILHGMWEDCRKK